MNVWQQIESLLDRSGDALKQWYEQAGTGVYSAAKISQQTAIVEPLLNQALSILVTAELLQKETQQRCINCLQIISDESRMRNSCVFCGDDQDLEVKTQSVYILSKAKTRDINWMLVVHGMNTVGTWQQEFSWLLANFYKHAVPVYIYKYGNIKIKPLLLLSRHKQVKKLAAAIRELQKHAPAGKPDVIAHSYGTLLLSEIIKNPAYQDIQLGRIILVGSIVRPDYDWQSVIKAKKVDQVLCHHSKRDHIVPLAHYTIPGSGPSGKIGFNDQSHISHHLEEDFGHSSYFEATRLKSVFPNIWKAFLTNAETEPTRSTQKPKWKPRLLRFVTHPLKLLILFGLTASMALLLVAVYLGLPDALRLIGWL